MTAAAATDLNGKQDVIIQTFKKFDKNQDGFISRQELATVFTVLGKAKFKDGDVEALMQAADTNKDGKISYEEFVAWVMSGNKSGGKEKNSGGEKFAPIDKRGSLKVDYKVFLPERFSVDVNSRFDLDKLTIGEGGYGKVFVANDREMEDRKVAIKQVTRTGDQKLTDDLKQEIEIMKELDHPNICKLLGTFEQGRDMFFIMELCEGGELFDRIIEGGKIDQAFAADIIKQVSSGLFYAHSRSIAHRDIKPENVVFCTKGGNQVKLIDWGLAISFMGSSMTSAVGSFTYAAPEVIMSNNIKSYTAKCDLWSLGVLTYVMLSGKPPFWGNHQQFVAKQKKEQYPLKGDPWDKTSPAAKDFIKKLLKADPEQRIAIDKVVVHEWLTTVSTESSESDAATAKDVLQNLKHFSGASTFERLCITAVARQLDHKNLTGIHQVFRAMDRNGDGVLSLREVQSGFAKIFGSNSSQVKQMEEVFEKLDLDGSNTIDYTEFCAAGLGHKTTSQDSVMWAAFKAFDKSNTGFIEPDDLKKILDSADVQDQWSEDVCHECAEEIIAQFDRDGDKRICFEDWKKLMETCWARHVPVGAGGDAPAAFLANPYSLLEQVSKLPGA